MSEAPEPHALDPNALESLDAAFELPDIVTDVKLRQLYEVLVHRMRKEAEHLPMTTVQMLLIERIAFNYVVLRSKERGELGGFNNSSIQKDYNTFWLTMTQEFNRLLGKVEGVSAADRKTLLKDVQQIIMGVLSTISDARLRTELVEKIAAGFDARGI
jgi:hypothetical protein